MAEILRSRHHRVYIIAPDVNRSGISHAVSLLHGPVKLTEHGKDAWACSGYPVDCVILAQLGFLPEMPDLVLSGINRGANLGTDIIYSGTAAAARQASLAGIPALALSLVGHDNYYWDMASLWSADHLDELLGLWEKNTFINVNIPNSSRGPDGMAQAAPAVKNYNDSLAIINRPNGNRWCFLTSGEEIINRETLPDISENDWDLVSRNFVSVSRVFTYNYVFLPGDAVMGKRGQP